MLPLILIKFFISVNYGLLTCLKDTVVVTARGGGAEVIGVLKGWCVLPVAILVSLLYSKMSNLVKRTTLFYTFMGGFLAVIFLLGFVLYPNLDTFSPHASADALTDYFGGKYSHWIAVYRNWIQSLIFIAAELWGSLVILLMFWGFANHITNVDEAKKSYTIYIAAGNFAALIMAPLFWLISKCVGHLDFAVEVQTITGLALISGLIVIGLYWWTNKYVLPDPRFYTPKPVVKKKKPSLRESFRTILKSKYLFHIAVLVVIYGLTINLVEITWKAHLKLYYPKQSDYQNMMGSVFTLVGITSVIASLFVCGNMMRRLGWFVTALCSPIVLGVTGVMFFIVVIFQDSLGPFFAHMGMTPLFFIVMFGLFHNVTSKMMKYSFFDPTKEMAYIPLSEDEKVKGKASIDVVGSRLGKSGSSWIQVALFDIVGTGSVLGITGYLLPVMVGGVMLWMFSVRKLNHHNEKRVVN